MSRMLIMKALFKSLTRYKTILTWPIIIFPMSCIAQVEAPSSDSSREGYLDLGTNKIFYSETGRIDSKYTVVFESGGGGSSADWLKVRSILPAELKTIAYDRSGLGKSGVGVLPRTMAQEVFELHELIKAKVKGPVILVGQSIGGMLAGLYASHHGENVTGLVLVDPTHESAVLGSMRYGGMVRLREKATGKTIPSPQLIMKVSPGYDSTADYLAEELQLLFIAGKTNPQPLRARPLIVLGAGIRNQIPGTTDEQWKILRDERDNQVSELARLSSNGIFIVDPKSRHAIQNDNPAIVAGAIEKVIQSVESRVPLTGLK
jgi:pimeloyl-ACP methyl ester carboxylesterase